MGDPATDREAPADRDALAYARIAADLAAARQPVRGQITVALIGVASG